jgi:hypothetical protein
MNRSILIVICDFLLVSLLVFSSVDINKAVDQAAAPQVKLDISTNQPDAGGKDLAAVMRLALNEERRNREQLLGELNRSREATARQEALLGEREKQVQTFQQQLQSREQEAQNLQQAQGTLQQQVVAAQTNIASLSQQLRSASVESLMSKERLAALEADLKKQTDQAAAMQQQLSQLAKSNQVVLAEKQQLSTKLEVAETEKRYASEQAARMQEEVKTERAEKAKLAEGLKSLANQSGELAQEVRESRPLTPNAIFNEFATNRVQARFNAVRPGIFGGANRTTQTETILVSNGTNVFALCHVQDTPLTLFNPGTDWESLTGTLSRNSANFPIRSVVFALRDPRVVLIPVTAAEARQLGSKIYPIATEPYKFQDAVLVGAGEGYYGECRFEIDLNAPGYVRLDHNVLKGLFGKFNPSRGDLVFSRTGQLLGVMVNGGYCIMLQNFEGAAAFVCGNDVRPQHTGAILSNLYGMIASLPPKLQ